MALKYYTVELQNQFNQPHRVPTDGQLGYLTASHLPIQYPLSPFCLVHRTLIVFQRQHIQPQVMVHEWLKPSETILLPSFSTSLAAIGSHYEVLANDPKKQFGYESF